MPPRTNSAKSTQVAAFIPVNSAGDQVGDAQEWRMPAGEETSLAVVPDLEPPAEQSASDRIAAMLSDAGSDASAKVQISRVPAAGGKKLIFVDEMPPEDFERGGLKMMAREYGGGDYEIRLYGATGESGQFGLRSRVRVTLEAPPRVFMPGGTSTSDVSAILQAMQESNAQLMRAMTEKPAVDPMQQMTQMLTMMKLMREATGGNEGNNLSETLKQIAALKEAGNLFEKPEKEEGLMGMLETMAPLLMAGMQKNPQALPVTVPPAIAAPAVTYQKPGEDDFTAIMELPMLTIGQKIKLRGTLATLLEMARQNVDHQEGAEVVLDFLPDEMIEVLDSDQWWEVFSQIVPSAIPLQAWFTVVRDLAVSQLEDDNDESTDVGPAQSDATSVVASGPIAPAPAATLKRATRAKAAGPAAAPGEPAPKP